MSKTKLVKTESGKAVTCDANAVRLKGIEPGDLFMIEEDATPSHGAHTKACVLTAIGWKSILFLDCYCYGKRKGERQTTFACKRAVIRKPTFDEQAEHLPVRREPAP